MYSYLLIFCLSTTTSSSQLASISKLTSLWECQRQSQRSVLHASNPVQLLASATFYAKRLGNGQEE